MLTTVKAEIDVGGNVRLLEPIRISKTTKSIVTLLEENGGIIEERTARAMLDLLRSNRLPDAYKPTAKDIDAQVKEAT